jgi:hypothetical protein
MGAGTWSDAVVRRVAEVAAELASVQQSPLVAAAGAGTVPGAATSSQGGSTPLHSYEPRERDGGWELASEAPDGNGNGNGGPSPPRPGSHAYALPGGAPRVDLLARARLPAFAMGPFGQPSVALHRYQHFLLVAGGIGITPVAGLHYALVRRLDTLPPPSPYAALVAAVLGFGNSKRRGVAGTHAAQTRLRSLTTIWSVRELELVRVFGHLLTGSGDATVAGAPTASADEAGEAGSDGARTAVTVQVHVSKRHGSHNNHGAVHVAPAGTAAARAARQQAATRPPAAADGPDDAVQLDAGPAGAGGARAGGGGMIPTFSSRPDLPVLMRALAARLSAAYSNAGPGEVTDACGRIPVAVVVCGPDVMVTTVKEVAQAENERSAAAAGRHGGAGGKAGPVQVARGLAGGGGDPAHNVVFHVHDETFLL